MFNPNVEPGWKIHVVVRTTAPAVQLAAAVIIITHTRTTVQQQRQLQIRTVHNNDSGVDDYFRGDDVYPHDCNTILDIAPRDRLCALSLSRQKLDLWWSLSLSVARAPDLLFLLCIIYVCMYTYSLSLSFACCSSPVSSSLQLRRRVVTSAHKQ